MDFCPTREGPSYQSPSVVAEHETKKELQRRSRLRHKFQIASQPKRAGDMHHQTGTDMEAGIELSIRRIDGTVEVQIDAAIDKAKKVIDRRKIGPVRGRKRGEVHPFGVRVGKAEFHLSESSDRKPVATAKHRKNLGHALDLIRQHGPKVKGIFRAAAGLLRKSSRRP